MGRGIRLGALFALIGGLVLARAASSKQLTNPAAGERIELGEVIGVAKAPGIELTRRRYQQGSFGGQIWIARVDPSLASVTIEASTRGPVKLTRITKALAGETFVAINGGFYTHKKPSGLVISHGKQLAALTARGGSGVFYLDESRPRIVHRDDFEKAGVRHAVQSIDRLVHEGVSVVAKRDDMPHDARSFVAVDDSGALSFAAIFDQRAITAESADVLRLGRASTSTGPTLHDVAELAIRPTTEGGLGARWVLNLDGGFSVSMHAQLGGKALKIIPHQATINALVASPLM